MYKVIKGLAVGVLLIASSVMYWSGDVAHATYFMVVAAFLDRS